MSTADIRSGGVDFADEVLLKIWRWEKGNWVLNTRIDRPHDVEPVTSMAFSPQPLDEAEGYILLTSGANGVLRTWRPWKTHDGDGTYFVVHLKCDVTLIRTFFYSLLGFSFLI